jgi:inosine-uridine nucleoside N-ribohydrolase
MNSKEFNEKFEADIFGPLQDYAQHWYDYSHIVTFHDPLAAATIFNKNICGFERGNVSIELVDGENAGMTLWDKDERGYHEIATTVSKEEFFKEYFSVF